MEVTSVNISENKYTSNSSALLPKSWIIHIIYISMLIDEKYKTNIHLWSVATVRREISEYV